MGSTTITITPDSKTISNSYVITAIPNGMPNANQLQIAARTLTSQQTQIGTVNGMGHSQAAATAAKGTVTFMNGSTTEFTIAAGTTLTSSNGVSVITDAPAVIPAAVLNVSLGNVTVSAHAATTGANGNIVAGAVSGTCCAASNSITVHNNNAFTGGQDAKNYNFVQQSDVDAFVSTAKVQMTQQANRR
jgi:hypothetical protein